MRTGLVALPRDIGERLIAIMPLDVIWLTA